MSQLTDVTKAQKITEAFGKLAIEYAQEGDKRTSKIFSEIMLDMPVESKSKLFDIIKKID